MSDLSPYSAPRPPKTITQVKDDKFLDFTCLHTWILLFTIGICLYIFSKIDINNRVSQIADLTLIVGIIACWLQYFATTDKVDKQKLKVKFFIGDLRGKHVINKFAVPVTFLEKLVPIVAVHAGGIIEFTGSKYGVLMETNPVRIAEEERAAHEKKIEKILNGIPTNVHFKTIACSRLEPRKPILQYLLEVTNKSTGDKAVNLHLTGLYNKIAQDDSKVISWKYFAFLGLGEWKNVNEARIQYGAVMPGLLKNMKVARLQPRIYKDENEIGEAYRTMFNEVIV